MSFINPFPILPPDYRPVSNITPFSFRDGVTYLEKLEDLRKYVTNDLTAWLIDELENENASIQLVINNLIEQFNSIVEEIVNDSVTVQDPVVAALVNNATSQTRTALNTILSAYYTKTAADTTFTKLVDFNTAINARYTKTETDAKIKVTDDKIAPIDTRVSSLETLTNTGRLSAANLDARYALKAPNVHAAFLGSSNSVPGTWVERFCTKMGYTGHNYSVGGGGFGSDGATQFIAQAAVATADNSYDHALVKFVFIGDLSNDVRSNNNITALAPSVFNSLRTTFPNARIIVLPLIWPSSTLNNSYANVNRIMTRLTELTNTALQYNVEIVEDSWSWLMDAGSWAAGGADSGAHCNTDGYNRIADFMVRWMLNGDSSYDRSFTVSNQGAVTNLDVTCVRSGKFVTISGLFTVPAGGLAINTGIVAMYYGCWPLHFIHQQVVKTDGTVGGTINIFNTGSGGPGLVRSVSALTAGEYALNSVYRVI